MNPRGRRIVEWHWADHSPLVADEGIGHDDAYCHGHVTGQLIYDLIDMGGTLVAIYTDDRWEDLDEVVPYFIACTRDKRK